MKNKHDKNYPYYEVKAFSDFKESLANAVEMCEGRPAFMYKKPNGEIVSVSYPAFIDAANYLGTAVTDLGIENVHAAILGDNSYEWLHTYITLINSSNVVTPVDRLLPFNEIMNVLDRSDSEIVFYSKNYDANLRENAEKMPRIKYFVGFDNDEDDGKFLSFRKLCEKGKALLDGGDTRYTDYKPEDEKLKMLVFTSGTTGTSKGVMLSLHNLVANVYNGRKISDVLTRCLSVLPYNHTYEAVCDILVSLNAGCTICINESIRSVAKNLKLYKPDYIMLVPLFVEQLYKKVWLEAESSGKAGALRKLIKLSNGLLNIGIDVRRTLFKSVHEAFGGNLKKIVCGGAPIRAEVGDFFESIGIVLCNGYGITECSPLVSGNREYFYDFVSCGVPIPCVQVKIDNPNEDGEGEIWIKGDSVMMGYYKNPEATAEAITDGWFHSGDYGKVDEEGRVYITGRKKNLIVLNNGKNIYPEEIEDYIMGIKLVKEVIVSAVRNDAGEEIALKAEIYPDPDVTKGMTPEETAKAVKDAVNEMNNKLPAHKQVMKVIINSEPFEKTTSNKIKRHYDNK